MSVLLEEAQKKFTYFTAIPGLVGHLSEVL
jgi:hypothetical protein